MNNPSPETPSAITAIVTGASRGIGAATARLLAHYGYKVAVNYCRDKVGAERVVSEILESGGHAIAVQADMGIEADIIRLFETADQQLGTINALVNNAAVNPSAAVAESDYAMLANVFRVNVFGTFTACREAIKYMKGKGGAIVNVSSEAAKFGGNKMTAYASSKAAINTFTVGFAREAAAYDIRVNVVSPGVIDTDAHKDATPQRLAALNASLPMGRMGKTDEVAETIAWLLSDKASYISGAVITVAGGR